MLHNFENLKSQLKHYTCGCQSVGSLCWAEPDGRHRVPWITDQAHCAGIWPSQVQ